MVFSVFSSLLVWIKTGWSVLAGVRQELRPLTYVVNGEFILKKWEGDNKLEGG
jgi:hypothetical protein